MILGPELTPVSELSGAFLSPRSPQHLQFAYYESSLVVEFLLERIGMEGLRRVLVDLSVGMPVDESLSRYLGSMELVDREFAQFARQRANELAPTLDWTLGLSDSGESLTIQELQQLLKANPDNYFLSTALAEQHLANQQWLEAAELLAALHEAFPSDAATARNLARCYRELNQVAQERATLQQLAATDADAFGSFERLAELAADAGSWEEVRQRAEQMIGVNPLQPVSQQWLARAAEKQQDPVAMIASHNALLQMEPADPAAVFLKLALAHEQLGDRTLAKRRVLQALNEAPRYREAHQVLLRLIQQEAKRE
jgi:tetratricopeptide (TPR) repeat protein